MSMKRIARDPAVAGRELSGGFDVGLGGRQIVALQCQQQ
jgi:hypothetical protein